MTSRAQLNLDVTEALAEVQAYRGSPLFLAFLKLLASVGAQHLETLADAKPDEVPRVQGALAQSRALHKAMVASSANHSPIGI